MQYVLQPHQTLKDNVVLAMLEQGHKQKSLNYSKNITIMITKSVCADKP
jgi:hypothetical protein